MEKTKPFKITLASPSSILIDAKYVEAFIIKGKKRVKVNASNNGKSIDFHAAITKHTSGHYKMYFSKAKQNELEITSATTFEIQLSEDTSKYGVEPCEEFEAVMLSDYEAYTIFEGLTPGKKRSIIYAISRYKSSQIRIDKTILFTNNLKRGIFDQKLWLKQN